VDAIVVEDLHKRYKTVQALDGVSFSVKEGEVFGLLGPNGAGKSTTVRTLATLTQPDSGRALVAGEDVIRHPNRVRRAIGYVAQDSGVDWEATGRENLMLQGRIHGMSGAALRNRVGELLELVGLIDAADRIARGYSGGMKRRLDIAIGLVHRPRVLFLDEPTTGLDPEARAAMWVEVERLAAQESLTILLTTHYLEEADRLAERVAIVSQGKVVVEGTPTALKADLRGELVTVDLAEADGHVEAALKVLHVVEGATELAAEGRQLRARVPNGAEAIPIILSALDEQGFPVASVSTSRPSLDDVYLHYTGRDFSTEDQEGKR
jgi:ABC-2 type transport system ATP-binding protein